jgi:hypothetical protein
VDNVDKIVENEGIVEREADFASLFLWITMWISYWAIIIPL